MKEPLVGRVAQSVELQAVVRVSMKAGRRWMLVCLIVKTFGPSANLRQGY